MPGFTSVYRGHGGQRESSSGSMLRAAPQWLVIWVELGSVRSDFGEVGGGVGGIVLGRCAIDGGWARRNSSNKTLTTSLTSQP